MNESWIKQHAVVLTFAALSLVVGYVGYQVHFSDFEVVTNKRLDNVEERVAAAENRKDSIEKTIVAMSKDIEVLKACQDEVRGDMKQVLVIIARIEERIK